MLIWAVIEQCLSGQAATATSNRFILVCLGRTPSEGNGLARKENLTKWGSQGQCVVEKHPERLLCRAEQGSNLAMETLAGVLKVRELLEG